MHRYIALVWNAHNAAASLKAGQFASALHHSKAQWTELISESGMSVFSSTPPPSGSRAYVLPKRAGIILGRIFPTNRAIWSPAWEPRFGEDVAANLCNADASFIGEYWGGYIALLRDESGAHAKVIRDCSGKIPCYRMEQDSVNVFFSDISDLRTLGISRFDIDWRYVAAFIYSCDIQVRNTGLLGVTELLAGEAVEFKGDSVRQYSTWDPRVVARRASVGDYEQAKELLKSTTQFCIDAWASVFQNITHRLSGGLDSAVVLGSLMRAPVRPRIACTHQFSDHPRDDERPYARLAAAAANVPLLELPRTAGQGQFDATLASGQAFPRPNIQAIFGTFDLEVNTKIAADLNAEASWTGQGGDHIFLQARTSLGAADYISTNGFNFGLVGAVGDAARLAREPYLSVLRSAWKLARGARFFECGESAQAPGSYGSLRQ